MPIISVSFLALTAAVWAALFLARRANRPAADKWILIAASFAVILWADWRFAAVLAALCVVTWYCAAKKHTGVGIAAALAALAFFKYTNFFGESFAKLFGKDYTALNIILPLGISFYTFSAISYLVDVRRGRQEVRSLLDVTAYLSFYPKLTSGPIQRSGDFFRQLDGQRDMGWDAFSAGVQIFMFGLFKKIVLADRISEFVNQVFGSPAAFGSATVLLAAVGYALQIYFDFSGYSDMAIGAARVLGFTLPRNFDLPYLSRNVTELWKRWHISLSSWLQDYLYISLGGSRKGLARTYANLILTMVLGGIWHGASWNYIIWGLLHGVALAVHKVYMKLTDSPNKSHTMLGSALATVFTFLFTTFCWIFFRAETLPQAMAVLTQIFSFRAGLEQPHMWVIIGLIVLAASSLIAAKHSRGSAAKKNQCAVHGFYPLLDLTNFWQLTVFFVFCGLILCLAYTGGSPFIYGKY